MTGTRRRPNFVFLLTDDHAAQSIGAYGSVVNETPRIDELAASGARFDNCFVTNSLCSPSRASILTGTYSHVNGVTTLFTPIDASQPTFISQLKAAGYRTAMVGKWHMGEGEASRPQGFDYWDVLINQGEYFDPRFVSAEGVRTVPGYATDVITDLALNWVDSLQGDEPWCVLIWHKAPHRPWEPDEKYKDLYTDPIPLPETFWDDMSTRSSSARRALMKLSEYLNKEDLKIDPPAGLDDEALALWKYQRYMEDYLRCVASVDDGVGRVVDYLAESGKADDTVVMYSSDQGFFLGEHGWFDKRFMYEESLRMPLIISYPSRITAGTVHDGIVTNVDFAQTILEAAGAEAHDRMQGRSFWQDLVGGAAPEPSAGMYYRYWENDDWFHKAPAHYGYRTRTHKLICYYNVGYGLAGTGPAEYPVEWELFDLVADPQELRNVYDDPAYADVRAELTEALAREQARVEDEPYRGESVPAHDRFAGFARIAGFEGRKG